MNSTCSGQDRIKVSQIVESQGDFGQATLTVIGSGGGGGMCNFNWGSHSAGEDTVIRNVRDLISHRERSYESDNW